jgi:hypothetical protein
MSTLTIIALDPGQTTGWATYRAMAVDAPDPIEDGKVVTEYYEEEWHRGQLGPRAHAKELRDVLQYNRTQEYVIVCEAFVPRPGKVGADLITAQKYIGQVELYAQTEGIQLIMQQPAQAKNFVKDDVIRRLGLWFPGWRHAMDATRHLVYYLTTKTDKKNDLLEKGFHF